MKIELLKQGKCSNSGSALLRLMQNNSTPTLDLLVRESIQNSLDAAMPGVHSVNVRFNYGKFDPMVLASKYDGIGDEIKSDFPCESDYLSITDINTVGLTGHLDGVFQQEEKNQNLGKLVFQIMKSQDAEGAGGSWGIGKTVYFRVGVGLVLYYSRIKNENGQFEERLASALVEDETRKDGLLRNFPHNLGIAFFGDPTPEDSSIIQATTDSEYIHSVLDVFQIPPLVGTTTGTTIIIPFVNQKELLDNSHDPEAAKKIWWQSDINEYLKVAILRWYFPRLNKTYSYGPYLDAYVGLNKIEPDKETPLFQKLSELYDCAFKEGDLPSWIHLEPILRTNNIKEKELGYFLFGKVTREELLIDKKHYPDPYLYAGLPALEEDTNPPLICFCRKPGMIVNYRNEDSITGGLHTDKNEFIIGVFVLNSKNEVISPVHINLDEYIRKSEPADHMSWDDYPLEKGSVRVMIVHSIWRKIAQALDAAFGDVKPTSGDASIDMNLARKFGKLLLPDENFGKGGSSKPPHSGKRPGGGGTIKSENKNKVTFVEREFKDGKVFLEYEVCIGSDNRKITFMNVVDTINGGYPAPKWEEQGMVYPCNIDVIALKCEKYDGHNSPESPILVKSNSPKSFKNYQISFLNTASGKCYGFTLDNGGQFKPVSFILRISLATTDKLIETSFDVDLKEGE
jgi:hypothetical protein